MLMVYSIVANCMPIDNKAKAAASGFIALMGLRKKPPDRLRLHLVSDRTLCELFVCDSAGKGAQFQAV